MPSRLGVCLLIGLAAACGGSKPDPTTTILAIHEELLQAHRDRDAEAFTALEADTITVANRGVVSRSPREERLAARRRYFDATRFAVYRDLRAPIVEVSRDQSLAWLFANVEVVSFPAAGTVSDSTHTVWAWIELYERRPEGWRLVGNVSNERPGSSP